VFCGKYKIGDHVFVKIGKRPLIKFVVLECVSRDTPHYRFDWSKHGFNAILNSVALPESSVVSLASAE
jgi:hypothetical protein